MDGNEMIRIGFLTGIILGCCFLVLFLKVTKKDGSIKCKFDERQQLVRGRGFKYGFFGYIIFNAACIVTDISLEKWFMDMSMTLLCGMLVGVAIYGSYSIWNDGYFSLNENPKRIVPLLAVITMLNMLCAAYRIHNGLLENGKLTFLNGCNLFTGTTCLFLLLVLLVKRGCDHRKAE